MLSLKSPLPSGQKVAIYRMGWNGSGMKRTSGYDSSLMATCEKEVEIYKAAGVDAVIHLWDGPNVAPFIHKSAMNMWQMCGEYGLRFGLLLDQWIGGGSSDPTTNTITALKSHDADLMLYSHWYLPEKYILEFDIGHAAKVDLAKVQAAMPDFPILSEQIGYSWPQYPNYQAAWDKNTLSTMRIPGLCLGFNDSGFPTPGAPALKMPPGWDYLHSRWDNTKLARVIEPNAGQYFWGQVASLSGKSFPYVAYITADDYEERTAILPLLSALAGVP